MFSRSLSWQSISSCSCLPLEPKGRPIPPSLASQQTLSQFLVVGSVSLWVADGGVDLSGDTPGSALLDGRLSMDRPFPGIHNDTMAACKSEACHEGLGPCMQGDGQADSRHRESIQPLGHWLSWHCLLHIPSRTTRATDTNHRERLRASQ